MSALQASAQKLDSVRENLHFKAP